VSRKREGERERARGRKKREEIVREMRNDERRELKKQGMAR
jgi:hypothetical protein